MLITHNDMQYEIELDNISYDHDYWCDTYISSAYNVAEDRVLDGEELDQLQDDLSLNMDDIIMSWLY